MFGQWNDIQAVYSNIYIYIYEMSLLSLILLWHNWVTIYFTNSCNIWLISNLSGSLPPSPADSGVSDVDPSSSSQTSDEESKIHSRLQIHGKTIIKITSL